MATGVTPEPRAIARIALIGLSETDTSFLADCFRQFKLQTVSIADHPETALKKDKFAGCVVPLVNGAEEILRAARQSPSNRHMLVYGIATDPHAAMKFSDFGINVVFKQPLERSAALRAVRATYLLALHEYRRYVRVPVAIEVQNMRKAYGKVVAVDDLSFTIEPGTMFGLLGPNGAGKTSTIRMMIGITLPDSGEIEMFGQPFSRSLLHRVGYLPEERGLYP